MQGGLLRNKKQGIQSNKAQILNLHSRLSMLGCVTTGLKIKGWNTLWNTITKQKKRVLHEHS